MSTRMVEPLKLVAPDDEGGAREQIATTMMVQAEAVLAFLNTKTGRKFPARTPKGAPTSSTLLIFDRLRDGYSVDDIRSVIAMKWRRCRTDTDVFFMRPMTLFRKSNFEQSIGELE